jgi:hypothetical protein
MTSKKVNSYCRECGKSTNHDILAENQESQREEYACDIIFQIVRCRGCETKSFRKVVVDIEAAYPSYNDQWEVPEDITIYPKSAEGHREIEDLDELLNIVRKIYSEELLVLKEDTKVLAGLGLRAVVEAVCNNLEIPGKSLEVRINRIATAGNISKKDAERLHGIRFMRNDAAHDIKTPKDESLYVALQIVEHLIASVFVLEKKVSGNLDTTTSKYEVFEKMLSKKISEFESGDEYPIAKFLGKDLRRVKESISTLEQELIEKITNGEHASLAVGKVDIYQSSKDSLQHFTVV